MMHGMNAEMPMEKKRENKLTGFNIQLLDDKTFLMRTKNKNYEYEKEYSYPNLDSLNKGIKEMLGAIGGKERRGSDALEQEKE